MPHQCENCRSLFLKTLETRALDSCILYKKRCKRCKFKYLLKKEAATVALQPATPEEWLQGRKITPPDNRLGTRGHVFTSEYSGRVSRAADDQLPYLNRLRQAEGIRHELPPAVG